MSADFTSGMPASWPWWAALLLLALLVQFARVIHSPRTARRKAGVAITNVLFAAALLGFAWPPQRPYSAASLVLLTPGASVVERGRARRAARAVAIGNVSLNPAERRRIEPLPDLAAVERRYAGTVGLTVLGGGLSAAYWDQIDGWKVAYAPQPPTAGLRHAEWPRKLETGQVFSVSGGVTAPDEAPYQLTLQDPSGDSVATTSITAGDRFRLDAEIRAAGRFLFALVLRDQSGALLETVPLPVHVVTPVPANILMILSSPSFESRYARDWARRGGARLAIRTAISRDRSRDEFLNRPADRLQPLASPLLSQFDLLIGDARAWAGLSAQERNDIAQAVRDHGMGVLLMIDTAAQIDGLELPFPLVQAAQARSTALRIDGAEAAGITVATAAARLNGDTESEALVADISATPIAAFRRYGAGRLGVTLVTNSHRLVTAGAAHLHAQYWQRLVSGIAPPRPAIAIEVSAAFPRTGRRAQICAYGPSLPGSAAVSADQGEPFEVALWPHPWRPGERCGYLWPQRSGWHQVRIGEQERQIYVFETNDWRTLDRAESTSATLLQAAAAPAGRSAPVAGNVPLPRWWFAAPLLLLSGMLWLEQKLHDA